jgi:hypothetical protein
VSVPESGPSATPETIDQHLEALTAALVKRGLVAERIGVRMVWAKNGDADPPDDDPLAATSPGLRQTVVCQHDVNGGLTWFWVWSGPTPGAAPELEYLCPAASVDEAADRIMRVLCLDGIDSEPSK